MQTTQADDNGGAERGCVKEASAWEGSERQPPVSLIGCTTVKSSSRRGMEETSLSWKLLGFDVVESRQINQLPSRIMQGANRRRKWGEPMTGRFGHVREGLVDFSREFDRSLEEHRRKKSHENDTSDANDERWPAVSCSEIGHDRTSPILGCLASKSAA